MCPQKITLKIKPLKFLTNYLLTRVL